MSTLILYLLACTAISAVTVAVLKYRRKAACPDSRRVSVSFLNDPLLQRTFHLPDKYVIYNMKKRIKENRAKLCPMWEQNKKYFVKIWTQVPLQRKELFVGTLLGELWELLEPYSMYTRDMKVLILPALPLSTILSDSPRDSDGLHNVVTDCADGKIPAARASPVCRAYALDNPVQLQSSMSSDKAVMAEAQEFASTLCELSLSMLLMQILLRYGRETNSSAFWYEVKKSPILVICCTGILACVLSILLGI